MGTADRLPDAQPFNMTSPTDFAALYDRNHAAVYHTALRITGNPADAEDVLQTVFLRILSQSERLDAARSPEAYLRRAAANAAIDLLRRRSSHGEVRLEDNAPLSAREESAVLKAQLRNAVAALEESDAMLFLLRYVEGMSNGELAEMFGQEKNNIAVRLHRIRQTLQAEMDR